MAEFLWIFWSFSLLGWVLERLFAAVTRSPRQRRRCLLLLPLCPVYGLGMAAVLALPPSLRFRVPLYLWGGLTATSVGIYLPLVGGDLFERVFLGLHRGLWEFAGPGVSALFSGVGTAAVPGCLSGDAAGGGAGGPCSHRCDVVAAVGLYRDAVCSLRFLAVTHDLEALRAVIWPVSADR